MRGEHVPAQLSYQLSYQLSCHAARGTRCHELNSKAAGKLGKRSASNQQQWMEAAGSRGVEWALLSSLPCPATS